MIVRNREMINGTIDELERYLPDRIRNQVMEYVQSIGKDTDEGYTYIMDERVFGRVMSYDTLPKQECRIEAHNKYIDIQISVIGAENIEVYQRCDLKECQSYDETEDVAFYEYEGKGHFAVIENIPGRFSVFFPSDAHQPKIFSEGKAGHIKKYVVKIDKNLFE